MLKWKVNGFSNEGTDFKIMTTVQKWSCLKQAVGVLFGAVTMVAESNVF